MTTPSLPNLAYRSGACPRELQAILSGRYNKYAPQLPAIWSLRFTYEDFAQAAQTVSLALNSLKDDGDTFPTNAMALWKGLYIEEAFAHPAAPTLQFDSGLTIAGPDPDALIDSIDLLIQIEGTWIDTPAATDSVRSRAFAHANVNPTMQINSGVGNTCDQMTAGIAHYIIAYTRLPQDGV